ncbi:MAG: hypothetical protein N4A72_18425 [Bacteroidales bacterium]|jgi:hypothetical protein|nr:hypothetical protein [Bacteroidales bacterium]
MQENNYTKPVKDRFEYDSNEQHWIDFPFIISASDFKTIDWDIFEKPYNDTVNSRHVIEEESVKAILNYVKEIGFFNKEEFDDLEFGIFDIQLILKDYQVVECVTSYFVDEDENSKIYWKDIYGVWKAYYKSGVIYKVERAYY